MIVRMCVAVSVGLFDGAINYIWNTVIVAIRRKIRNFGFLLLGQTLGKGKTNKCKAARAFFEKLHMLNLLSESKKHSIVKNACKNLLNAHLEYNNSCNEPPFAQRLFEISTSMEIPETVKQEYVYTVLMGYVGNPYGVSNGALIYYEKMISGFSPKSINYLLTLIDSRSLFSEKILKYSCCRKRYLNAIEMIESDSMDIVQIANREKLI